MSFLKYNEAEPISEASWGKPRGRGGWDLELSGPDQAQVRDQRWGTDLDVGPQ